MEVTILRNSDLMPAAVAEWDAVPRIGEQVTVAELGGVQFPVVDVVWFTDFTQVQGALSPVAVVVQDTVE